LFVVVSVHAVLLVMLIVLVGYHQCTYQPEQWSARDTRSTLTSRR